eukprot:Clim_evm88s147 gene=Clim_evmTU88s147
MPAQQTLLNVSVGSIGESTKKKQNAQTKFKNFKLKRIVKQDLPGVFAMGLHPERQARNLLFTASPRAVSFYDNTHCGDYLDLLALLPVDGECKASDSEKGAKKDQDEIMAVDWLMPLHLGACVIVASLKGLRVVNLSQGGTICSHDCMSERIIDVQGTHGFADFVVLTKEGNAHAMTVTGNGIDLVSTVPNVDAILRAPSGGFFYVTKERDLCYSPATDTTSVICNLPNRCRQFSVIDWQYNGETSSEITMMVVNKSSFKLFRSSTGANLEKEWSREDVTSCAVSASKKYVALGHSSGVVTIVDLKNGKTVHRLQHEKIKEVITSISFAPEDSAILYTTEEGYVFRWDYIPEEELAAWRQFQEEHGGPE